ncbi:hypothetical protein [Janibacter melonis]|uniref:hypothetical protein n=1 Tax=Janibacter melonis TaxID=262209 RepID=UPI001918D2D1|nr:hypothetical protein [Janibacter melonis]
MAHVEPHNIDLDFSRHGTADVIRTRLFPQERCHLRVGDVVFVAGDSVEPSEFEVTDIDTDGSWYTFTRH